MTLDAEGGETETSGLLPEAAGASGTMPSAGTHAPSRCRSCRYRVAMLAGLGYVLCYAQRLVLPIGIVQMQNDFEWDKLEQGQVLGSFFVGYALMMPIGGMLATNFSAGKVAGLGMLASSLVALAMPTAARWGSASVLSALRVAQGLVQGVVWPGFAAIWTKWAPPAERSTMSSFPQAGGYIGNLLFGAIIGWQCDHREELLLFGGWEGAFNLTTLLGLVWASMWLFYVADSPALQVARGSCSSAECRMIESAISAESANAGLTAMEPTSVRSQRTAGIGLQFFCRALSHPAVLAICAASWSTNTAFYILQNAIPSYLRDVYGLSFTSIGLIVALPQLFLVAMIVVAVNIDLRLRAMSQPPDPRSIRRVLTCAGIGANLVLFVGMAAGTVRGMTVNTAALLFVLGYAILGLPVGAGFGVSHLDIAPAAAGVIVGITNTYGSVAGVVAPWAMGYLTTYPAGRTRDSFAHLAPPSAANGSREVLVVVLDPPPTEWLAVMEDQWARVFAFAAAMDVIGVVCFWCWAQATAQQALDPRASGYTRPKIDGGIGGAEHPMESREP